MVFETNALPNNDFVFFEATKTFVFIQEQTRWLLRIATP